MLKKKDLSLDELFYGMPHLHTYFKNREIHIRKTEKREKVEESVEKWREKKEKLLQVAIDMRIEDLELVYYFRTIQKLQSKKMLAAFERLSEEVENFLDIKPFSQD